MITITRGSDVTFSTSFNTAAGLPYTPSSAYVRVAYTINSEAHLDSVSLTRNVADGKWRATWSTKYADAGQVDWYIYATGATGSTDQGQFLIIANTANLQQTQ